eukprot:s1722_g8.t1
MKPAVARGEVAMGNIDGLAGGLVLLHGTPTQKRQLQRGELRSLLEDAQADFPAKHRWPLWFEAFTKGSMEPVLILRLAELRDLEEKNGWKAASPSWWTWFMSWRWAGAMPVQLLQGTFEDPCRAFNFSDLGDVELQKGDTAGALAAFNAALEVEPRWPVIWLHRAHAKMEHGDFQGAIEDASATLAKDGRIVRAYAVRGAQS